MTTFFRLIFMAFTLLALYAQAQPAMNSGANAKQSTTILPLRNLQIEVRQVQREDTQRAGIQSNTRVEIGNKGQGGPPAASGLSGQLQIEQRQSRQSSSASQYALVLNGRSTRISLGTSTPLRLMQTYFRNGTLFVTQGTVLLQANTGFVATPRWDGGDRVELEISAQQSGPAEAGARGANGTESIHSSGASSTLVVPLGEWTTVAQSEQDDARSTSGLGSASSQTGYSTYDVQVRLTLK